jgi:hypothetical protein
MPRTLRQYTPFDDDISVTQNPTGSGFLSNIGLGTSFIGDLVFLIIVGYVGYIAFPALRALGRKAGERISGS